MASLEMPEDTLLMALADIAEAIKTEARHGMAYTIRDEDLNEVGKWWIEEQGNG